MYVTTSVYDSQVVFDVGGVVSRGGHSGRSHAGSEHEHGASGTSVEPQSVEHLGSISGHSSHKSQLKGTQSS